MLISAKTMPVTVWAVNNVISEEAELKKSKTVKCQLSVKSLMIPLYSLSGKPYAYAPEPVHHGSS